MNIKNKDSKEEELNEIERAWRNAYARASTDEMQSYVTATFDDYLVVNVYGDGVDTYFRVPYGIEAGEYVFASPGLWQEVERVVAWVTV